MQEIAMASINSFGNSPKADAPPSEDSIFVLTSGQLRQIVTQAVQDELSELKATVATQGEEIRALRADEKLDHDDIRDLYDALASLEQSHIQPLQKDRGEILRALIAANGGKMLAKDARQKMHLGKEQFSLLLSRMGEYIETTPFRQDKRKLVLIIK